VLVVVVQVADNLLHPIEREVLRVEGEHSALVHVVCERIRLSMKARGKSVGPMSVHIVSSGMPAAE
jgi:hypothetical protein